MVNPDRECALHSTALKDEVDYFLREVAAA